MAIEWLFENALEWLFENALLSPGPVLNGLATVTKQQRLDVTAYSCRPRNRTLTRPDPYPRPLVHDS